MVNPTSLVTPSTQLMDVTHGQLYILSTVFVFLYIIQYACLRIYGIRRYIPNTTGMIHPMGIHCASKSVKCKN